MAAEIPYMANEYAWRRASLPLKPLCFKYTWQHRMLLILPTVQLFLSEYQQPSVDMNALISFVVAKHPDCRSWTITCLGRVMHNLGYEKVDYKEQQIKFWKTSLVATAWAKREVSP